MSELFDSHEADEELRKEYADFVLCITDLEDIDHHILNKQESIVLARHDGIITDPAQHSVIHDAMLTYDKYPTSTGTATGFRGYVVCEPLLPASKHSYYWSESVAYDIEEACRATSNLAVTRYDHARDELYIYSADMSEQFGCHVRFSADANSCRVDIVTAHTDSQSIEGDAISILQQFAHIWGDIQNSIVRHFQAQGDQPIPKQIVSVALGEPTFQPEIEAAQPAMERNPFDDIGGLTEAKRKLQEYATIFNNYEEARAIGITVPHFFLYGPPGTGKTSLIHAFSESIGAELDVISANEVRTRYISDATSMMIDRIDKAIDKTGPQVVFLDELDIYINENTSSSEYTHAAKTLGMKLELVARDHPDVIIVGATNATPDNLMPALIRPGRFEAIIAPAPNLEERAQIWACHLDRIATHTILLQNGESIPLYEHGAMISDDELRQLMSGVGEIAQTHTPGYAQYAELSDTLTGADIKEILDTLKRQKFVLAKALGKDMSPITPSEIERAIQIHPSR